jgi:hypothetical protein
MSRWSFAVVLAIPLPWAGCAQGDLDTGATFGMSDPTVPDEEDDDDGTADDDGSTGGSAGETSGGETTAGPADGTTSAAGSSGDSSGAPVTASADESSSVGSGIEDSSSSASATTEAGDEMAEMGDEMPMEDDGMIPTEPWESCALMDCDAGSLCINVTGLRDYSPYCAPECMTDDDCPYPGGDALVTCALVQEGETEPTHCAVICEYDDAVLGDCPVGMQCAEVPDQMTQIAVCMWP